MSSRPIKKGVFSVTINVERGLPVKLRKCWTNTDSRRINPDKLSKPYPNLRFFTIFCDFTIFGERSKSSKRVHVFKSAILSKDTKTFQIEIIDVPSCQKKSAGLTEIFFSRKRSCARTHNGGHEQPRWRRPYARRARTHRGRSRRRGHHAQCVRVLPPSPRRGSKTRARQSLGGVCGGTWTEVKS